LPCPLRFHFAAGIGWDVGGLLACLAPPLRFVPTGFSLQAVIALALPMVAVQAFLLDAIYAPQKRDRFGWNGIARYSHLPGLDELEENTICRAGWRR
jgi:hypothetical protein